MTRLSTLLRSFLPRISSALSSQNLGLKLKRSVSGYVLILMTALVPVLLFGTKYLLDLRTLHKVQLEKENGGWYKRCAKEAALAVAKKWNPGLTLFQQRDAMYKIADDVYNSSPLTNDSVVARAIPRLDLSGKITVKNEGGFNPIQMKSSDYQSRILDKSLRTVEYQEEINNYIRGIPEMKKRNLVYPISILFNSFYNFSNRDSALVLKDTVTEYTVIHDNTSYHYPRYLIRVSNNDALRSSGISYAGIPGTPKETINATVEKRKNLDNDKVKIEIENDKIKVTTDGNYVGYAVPAECNVDIVLGIPVNGAANNADNLDNNTPTTGSPYVCNSEYLQEDGLKTPMSQIGQAFYDFVKNNFHYTRGVNIGIIPYCGMVSLPLDRIGAKYATDPSKVWAVDPENFDRTVFPGNQNTYQGYIRPCMLYGLFGGNGDISKFQSHYGVSYSWTNVMVPQGRIEAKSEYGNNLIYYGDVLSTNDPAGNVKNYTEYSYSPKFMRRPTYKIPAFPGRFNFLSMDFESLDGHNYVWCNPYHIVEMQSDLLKITDLLNLFYPFNFSSNGLSNFIFVPFVWANNLFQSWSKDPKYDAVDTTDATPSTMTNETSGRLSAPSKGDKNSGRKKALILVVNKPDWFEPGELTYLGYDNDYSEIPMIESDCIRGDIDYSDTTKYFADGTKYDGTVQGAKKIIKLTGFTRNATTGYYECDNGTATLTFPQKYLVKLKVGRGSAFNNQNIQITDLGDSGITMDYRGLAYGDGKIYALSHSRDTTGAVSCYDIALGAWYTLAEVSSLSGGWHGLAYDDYSGRLATCGAEYNALRIMNMSTNQWETNWEGSISSNYGYQGKFYSLCGNTLRITNAFTGALISTIEFPTNSRFMRAYEGHIYVANGAMLYICDDSGGNQKSYDCPTFNGIGDWCVMNGRIWVLNSGGDIYVRNLDGSNPQLVCNVNSILGSDSARSFFSMCCDGKRNLYIGNYKGNSIPNHVFCVDLGITSSLQFVNVSGDNTVHSVDTETTYWITPDQISDTKDPNGNYSITFDATNLRLISAEITNRPYVKVTPTITRNGNVFTLNAKVPFVVPIRVTGSDASITYKNVLTNSNVPRSFSHSQAFQVSPEKITYEKTFDGNDNPVYTVTLNPTNITIGSPQIGTIEVKKASKTGLSLDSKTPSNGSFSDDDGATFGYETTVSDDVNETQIPTATTEGSVGIVYNSDGSNSSGTITCPTGAVLHVKAVPHGSVTFYGENNIDLANITATPVSMPDTSENTPISTTANNTRTFNITGSTKFHFEGGKAPSGVYNTNNSINSTMGPNFGHNLSLYKIKYSCKNSRILYANLKDQWIRDYEGQYGRQHSRYNPLILSNGQVAIKLVDSDPYSIYSIFDTHTDVGVYIVEGTALFDVCINNYLPKFRDPCFSVWNIKKLTDQVCCGTEYNNPGGTGGDCYGRPYGVQGSCGFYMQGKKQPWLHLLENGSQISGNLLTNSYSQGYWSNDTVELPLSPEISFIRGGFLLQTFIKNGMEKELILQNPTPYEANAPYLADSSGVVQDATIKTYLEQNGDSEGKGGIYLVRLPSNLSTQIVAGDYICFNGDGDLDVIVAPLPGTIKFGDSEHPCPNEDETKHELYKEYNFCLEPSQMKNNEDGTQSVTFSTTGDVTVTATYEIKQQTKVTVTKPNNVAFATINVTGHKKEMECTVSTSQVIGYPPRGDGFRFDGTRVYRYDTHDQNNHNVNYSDDFGVTWKSSNINLTNWISIGDLPNAISFKRPYANMCLSYDDGQHYITRNNVLPYDGDATGGFKWSRNVNAEVKYMLIYNDGHVAVSDDGFNWTNGKTLPDSSDKYFNGAYHINGKWWTVSNQLGYLYRLDKLDESDEDTGWTWTRISPLGNTEWIRAYSTDTAGLAYGSNLIMLIATSYGKIATSRDEFQTVNWRSRNKIGLNIEGMKDVCYANGNFIIGFNKGTSIAYTTFHDGVMWRENSNNSGAKEKIGISQDIDQNISEVINTEEYSNTVYCTNMTITDISVTYDKVAPLNPSMVIEYKKIRLPKMSTCMDYSTNPYTSHMGTGKVNSNFTGRWHYDAEKGFYVSNNYSGHHTQIYFDIPGDHSSLIYSDSVTEMRHFTSEGWATLKYEKDTKLYDTSGLGRTYTTFGNFIRGNGNNWNDYEGAPGTISLMMQTMTLPINAVLYFGKWQSDANGNWNNLDATSAVREVTKSACAKLKQEYGDNLRIYLIKYRKQAQYKHPITGEAVDFDYDYLDDCASPRNTDSVYDEEITDAEEVQKNKYIYDISADTASDAKEKLDNALKAIAKDIRKWAGYEEAKNVN